MARTAEAYERCLASDHGEGGRQQAEADRQLAILMDLGFQAVDAIPLCDGVTPVEELVERLMQL